MFICIIIVFIINNINIIRCFFPQDEIFRARGDQTGSTTWAMTHMSTGAPG